MDGILKRLEAGPDEVWRETDRHVAQLNQRDQRERERKAAEEQQKCVSALDLPFDVLAILNGTGKKFIDTECVRALQSQRTLTILSGRTGCGKTVAAAGWLYSWALEFRQGLWLTAARLARWNRYETEKMNQVLMVSRLVLDDLGAEFIDTKGFFMALLDELVNERYANGRQTVIATNLNSEEFKDRYSERIVDRIREKGQFVAIASLSLRPPSARP